MSADTIIVVDDKYYSLDRWRFFSSIESGDTFTKDGAANKIMKLIEAAIDEYSEDNDNDYNDFCDKLDWLTLALKIISSAKGDKIIFYSDEDDRYCSGFNDKKDIVSTHKREDYKTLL